MGLFSNDEDYNEELRKSIQEYKYGSQWGKRSNLKKIKKYSKKKLEKEQNLSISQTTLLKQISGDLGLFKMNGCHDLILSLIHLNGQNYTNNIIGILTNEGLPVVFPKIDKTITNNAGIGALGGGILFGTTGAIMGGALGASNQNITDKLVPGETGKLKVAEKGIVIKSNEETLKIPWNEVKQMKNNKLELGDGKNIIFYEIYNEDIISRIVNHRAGYVEEEGW
nr:hypothetical protein [Methanobrevibacter arboriphilus]